MNHFHKICFCLVLILITCFIITGSIPAQAKVFNLSFVTMSPGISWNDRAQKAWVNWLERESNGQIKLTYHYGTLVAPGDEYQAVKGGLAEMGSQYSQFMAGQVNINEVLRLSWMRP